MGMMSNPRRAMFSQDLCTHMWTAKGAQSWRWIGMNWWALVFYSYYRLCDGPLQKFDALLVSMHTDWKRVHYALRWARWDFLIYRACGNLIIKYHTPIIETTGRTLSATLAYLAIYQDEQEKAIEEINRCLPDGREMVSNNVCPIYPIFLIVLLIVVLERVSSYAFFTTNPLLILALK